jgi:hypothetical protein
MKDQSDNVCYVVSENIVVSNIVMIFYILKKSAVTKGYKFSLYALKFIGVVVVVVVVVIQSID